MRSLAVEVTPVTGCWKQDVAYATPLARYAVVQYRAGRHVGGQLNFEDGREQRGREDGCEQQTSGKAASEFSFDRAPGL